MASVIRSQPLNPADFAIKATSTLHKITEPTKDQTTPFLTALHFLLSNVEAQLTELHKGGCPRGSKDEEKILKLLEVMERLACWPSSPATRICGADALFNPESYTRLYSIVCGRTSVKNQSKRAIEECLRDLTRGKSSRSRNDRKKFRESLKNFAPQKKPRGVPLSDLITSEVPQRANDKNEQSLRVLHTILHDFVRHRERCEGDFRVNLALACVERLHESKEWNSFGLFLLHRHSQEAARWREVRLRVYDLSDPIKPSKVRIHTSDNPRISSPQMFCSLVRNPDLGCLIFNATNHGLECVGVDPGQLSIKLRSPSVSLATMFNNHKLRGDDQLKLLLSYLLSKAIWQFYDTDWMVKAWTKETIHFMRETLATPEAEKVLALIHKPFFFTDIRSASSSTTLKLSETGLGDDLSFICHKHPKILALGIMLLEIQLGQGIENHRPDDYLDENGKPRGNADHFTALRLIESPTWRARNTYLAVDQIIEVCLRDETGKLGNDASGIRENLYTYVVSPLGRIFKDAWSVSGEPETCELDPVSFEPAELSPHSSAWSEAEVAPIAMEIPVVDQDPLPTGGALSANDTDSLVGLELSDLEDRQLLGNIETQETDETRYVQLHHERSEPQSYLDFEGRTAIKQLSSAPPNSQIQAVERQPAHRDDFRIAIICALKCEYDAVSLLFDKFWDEDGDPYGRAPSDSNQYTTGRIGKHDVVLVLLPDMGKVSAAGAAASFRISYNRLEIVFLVGICGGVPSSGANEVLLGDVVIGKNVIQYDFGRQYPDRFKVKDMIEGNLCKPTRAVQKLVVLFETEFERGRLQEKAAGYLQDLQFAALRGGRQADYHYPGQDQDNLFASTYLHRHRAGCDECGEGPCDEAAGISCADLGCEADHLVARMRLDTKQDLATEQAQAPVIHVGRIGSGDMVLKSGSHRDALARQHQVIAFEMESAGVWEEVPCVVIKGICDYADSHKSKLWQNFAAATAAAVTRAVLARYA